MTADHLRILLNYGLIAPLISFILFLVYYISGFNPLGNISWISVWVLPTFIYLGVKKHRDEKLGGYLKYGKALLYCLLIVLMYAVIFDLLVYIYGVLINDAFVQMTIDETKEGMEQARQYVGEETYQMVMTQADRITLDTLVFSDFRTKIFGGIIVSLIISGILKKKKPEDEEYDAEEFEDVQVIEENTGDDNNKN